jgi:hypothetical protein
MELKGTKSEVLKALNAEIPLLESVPVHPKIGDRWMISKKSWEWQIDHFEDPNIGLVWYTECIVEKPLALKWPTVAICIEN